MELSIVCPLCSQPGFPDVNSLWLTLIRASIRQLSCPVCHEILCGLDKLTIHLVSHSLHDQMAQTCLATNLLPPPEPAPPPCPVNQDLQNSNNAGLKEPMQVTEHESKSENAVASYVLINFPTLENVSLESASQITGVEQGLREATEHETSSLPTQDVSISGLSSCQVQSPTEISFSSFLHSKSNDISAPLSPPLVIPQNIPAQVTGPVKYVPFPLVLPQEMSLKDKISDKLFTTDRTVELNQNTHPQYVVQRRTHNLKSNMQTSTVCPSLPEPDCNDKMEECVSKPEGCAISCGLCDLSFKDTNIAMLHQQLIHNISPHDENSHQLFLKNDERGHFSKQWSKRSTTASTSRDAASPLHKYPCHICNKVFRMRGSLMVHLRVAHSPNVSSDLASRRGSSSSLVQPVDFTTKLSLQDLTVEEAKLHDLCGSENVCGKMNDHTQLSQVDAAEISTTAHKQALSTLGVTGSGSTMCPKLSPVQSPPTPSAETTGMIFPCSLCNKTYSKEALLTQHLKTHESKQWECDVCYKSFTTKYFLKKHKRLHTGEMPYTCSICNKSFTFQQSYHKHLLYHSDEKPHSCSECGRAFKELSTLHNHQRIHTGEKPWACETCENFQGTLQDDRIADSSMKFIDILNFQSTNPGKCFRQRVSYLVHRRIHTGAMPYECTVCLKSFRYKVSQRTHKCIVQAAGDAPPQSSDLLQQLLQTPSKELPCVNTMQPSVSSEPHLKEQMQLLNIKQEQQHNSHSATSHLPSGDNHNFLIRNEIEKGFNGFFTPNPPRGEVASKVVPLSPTKLVPNLSSNNIELHGSTEALHTPAPVPQTTPPPAEFNIDLLQDILSMVMSPTPENVPSPSTQMSHLSLSASQNDDDLEAGLDLRQLLYGSCDSESTP